MKLYVPHMLVRVKHNEHTLKHAKLTMLFLLIRTRMPVKASSFGDDP